MFAWGRAFIFLAALCLAASYAANGGSRPERSAAQSGQEGVVIQEWDLSCGAAALATLLTYDLGDPVTERAIVTAMLRRTDWSKVRAQGGFSLLDLQEYAESRGYEATGYGQVAFEDLLALIPAIVPVQFQGSDHFVVVRGVRGDSVHFADPSFGNRTMPIADFERAWVKKVVFVVAQRQR